MALLDHPHILSLLGVVTVPRDMPAMLVLEYCDNGTHLECVTGSDQDYIDTGMLLTFCHDVACGMHYLSSRRIVDRDVTARNVLLDVANTCKVSDFGMSTAVAGDKIDSEYATSECKAVNYQCGGRPLKCSPRTSTQGHRMCDAFSRTFSSP